MIPVNGPCFDGNERKYLAECLAAGGAANDAFVARMETALAEYCGRKYGIAVSSGTAALETTLYALGVRAGQKVVLPAFAPISGAVAVLRRGAIPLLVDIDPETWCLDCEQAGRLVEKGDESLKAVLPAAVYGHPADMDPLITACGKYRVALLEDAAQSLGAEYASRALSAEDAPVWKKCGAFGQASVVSFGSDQIVTTGEGGMVLTDSEETAARARSYRNLCGDRGFRHEDLGYNFRLDGFSAAVGVAQLERLDEFVAKKRQIAAWYSERLQDVPELRLQPVRPWAHPVYWAVAVELNRENGRKAADVMEDLRTHQIASRPFFLGLHAQPALRYLTETADGGCPHADAVTEYGFCLPNGVAMTESQVHIVCEVLKNIVRR